MSFEIRVYNEINDAEALFDLMRSEEDWTDYSADKEAFIRYKSALNACIVYVCYEDGRLCGFLRARDDFGYGIYIYDLLVHRQYRGKSYGRLLIEYLCKDYKGAVYVMSDVDGYYKKQGYCDMAGSIITVRG